MTDGHEKRIEKRSLNGIIKSGLKREYVGYNRQINNGHRKENRYHDCLKLLGHVKPAPCKEQHVKAQNKTHSQHNQPDNGRLLEVLLKGLEKGPDRVSVIIPRKLQRYVIYSGRRRPDCKNGNTAHEPQNVQYDQISKLPDKTPDRIIIIKKTRQHKSYPFSFL